MLKQGLKEYRFAQKPVCGFCTGKMHIWVVSFAKYKKRGCMKWLLPHCAVSYGGASISQDRTELSHRTHQERKSRLHGGLIALNERLIIYNGHDAGLSSCRGDSRTAASLGRA